MDMMITPQKKFLQVRLARRTAATRRVDKISATNIVNTLMHSNLALLNCKLFCSGASIVKISIRLAEQTGTDKNSGNAVTR